MSIILLLYENFKELLLTILEGFLQISKKKIVMLSIMIASPKKYYFFLILLESMLRIHIFQHFIHQ